MNKKILILMFGIIFLTGFVTPLVLTPVQLSTVTDNQIKNYLLSNLDYEGYLIDHDDQKVYFTYSATSLEPYIINGTVDHFFTKNVTFTQELSFFVVKGCMASYPSNICWNNLVENFNYLNTRLIHPITGETVWINPVYLQLKNQLIKEYKKIQTFRDAYQDNDVEIFITESPGNVPNPII